jgi:uncharacterized membrane protein YjjB (DUF3815 family)
MLFPVLVSFLFFFFFFFFFYVERRALSNSNLVGNVPPSINNLDQIVQM